MPQMPRRTDRFQGPSTMPVPRTPMGPNDRGSAFMPPQGPMHQGPGSGLAPPMGRPSDMLGNYILGQVGQGPQQKKPGQPGSPYAPSQGPWQQFGNPGPGGPQPYQPGGPYPFPGMIPGGGPPGQIMGSPPPPGYGPATPYGQMNPYQPLGAGPSPYNQVPGAPPGYY